MVSRGHTDSLLTKPRRQCIAVTAFAGGAGRYGAAEIAQAQADAAQQIKQALTNAQTQDQQLNQQALDQLAGAQQQVSTMQSNLQAGIAQSMQAVQSIQSTGQQEVTSDIAALAKANANRNANWATDANNLIEQALVHPLQEGLNYVTMGAGFLALIPGLEPLMVVAGAASLANAGISALEGSYMSAGMYAVTGVIPFAGKIADIGEMADGAAAALNEAAPAAEVVASDAGQVESQVLAADGVAAKLPEASPPPMAIVPRGARQLGRWGEVRLSQELGGLGIKPSSPLITSDGARYFDRLIGNWAYEAKAGINVGLTTAIQRQVLKDAELIAIDRIKGATWYFFQGVQQQVLDLLDQNGIQYVVY